MIRWLAGFIRALATLKFTVDAEQAAQDELSHDLFNVLVDHLYDHPAEERRHSQWVMSGEWFEECAKIGGRWAYGGTRAMPQTMLGLPLAVTDDGGFPHLERVAP